MIANEQLVSVNITTYNRASLLKGCLDSVLSQTYKNMEVVIVDDCSTDSTAELLSSYARLHKNIKTFRKMRNEGNARARNLALEKSSGVYVAFMDDDDEWIDSQKIEKQVEIISRYPDVGMVCTSVKRYSSPSNYTIQIVEPPDNINLTILSGNGLIYSPTVLTRANLLSKIKFDERLQRGIDSDFYRNLILREKSRVYFLGDVCVAIHEYGPRLTPIDSVSANLRNMSSHLIAIRKYLCFYIIYPRAFWIRLYSITVSLRNILRILKTK
jgi:teichuronic acid biosynthesis glycosyltransferase TuaG